jgi:hypothetical protein
MIHKSCGGKIVLDCTSMYIIQSPSIIISSKGISPGMIQIDSCKDKKGVKLLCSKCQITFSGKDDFENNLLDTCGICGNNHPPSKLRVSEFLSKVCEDCIDRTKSSKLDINKRKDQILAYFGEALQKLDAPSLLSILLKK